MMSAVHTGSCLCGAVRFEVGGELAPIQVCHCGQCRKAQGSAFAANLPVAIEDFRLIAGGERLKSFASSPGKERVFCADCGSPIFSRHRERPGVVRLRAGSLDEPVSAQVGFHFHVASKASWWPITDERPQHAHDRRL